MSANTVASRTIGGKTFRASQRTADHLNHTIKALAKKYPGTRLRVIQGCYSNGPLSAGTHDGDAVLDVEIVGLNWWTAQRFLRELGWAAWYRHTGTWAAQSAWHIHMISLGYTTPVGEFVPGQVDDYYRHALGLKGQHNSGSDKSWFPPDIAATIYVPQEEAMAALTADIRAVAKKHNVTVLYLCRVGLKYVVANAAGSRKLAARTAAAALKPFK